VFDVNSDGWSLTLSDIWDACPMSGRDGWGACRRVAARGAGGAPV